MLRLLLALSSNSAALFIRGVVFVLSFFGTFLPLPSFLLLVRPLSAAWLPFPP
jgi:hypothetical protein